MMNNAAIIFRPIHIVTPQLYDSMIGLLGHDSALARLYLAWDILG